MSYDVATLLAQYEHAPMNEPMHGKPGEVRRNPSSDQKKVRRQMSQQQKKAEAEQAGADTKETIAQLLRRASVAPTLAEQTELMQKVESLTTQRLAFYDTDRALDFTVKEAVEIVPAGVHEMHSGETDWLMGLTSTASTATLTEAEHELVAQASMWFDRVPDYVKVDQTEFRVQAANKARYEASPFGESAEAAASAFVTEADRLYRQGVRSGSIKTATVPDPDSTDQNDSTQAPGPRPDNQAPYVTDPHEPGEESGPHLDRAVAPAGAAKVESPLLKREINKHLQGTDANGVSDMAQGYAEQQVNASLQTTASVRTTVEQDDQLSAVLAGFGPGMLGEVMGGGEGAAAEMPSVPGMPGGGGGGVGGGVDKALDSSASGVESAGEDFANSQVQASSQVPQVGSYGQGGSSGLPQTTFPTFDGNGAEPRTDSNRAPALQELSDFTGWNGHSVVPANDSGAEGMNNDMSGQQDAAMGNQNGFPVSGSRHTASKENTMSEHAQCPTCGGHGKVAVRKQAYSGLPQIDQIVNADESPGTTPYPGDVAFPLTGWGESPEQGGQNVQNAVNQAEQQISDRNARSPLVSGATANGRDNSGWMGDMGAKGTDYPGYSTPAYDGSTSTGYQDPVYGQGGDNGDQPLRPFGEMEANDETNNPAEPFDYSGTHDAGQGYRSVSPGMSTQGSQDPFIAQAQAEQRRLQDVINTRVAQRQGR